MNAFYELPKIVVLSDELRRRKMNDFSLVRCRGGVQPPCGAMYRALPVELRQKHLLFDFADSMDEYHHSINKRSAQHPCMDSIDFNNRGDLRL